jgi:hypothetical protein
MSYVEKVKFLSKMQIILLTLPIDIQKYIGTFYNKKYDNKYIKLMILKSPKVKIPEQIYIKKQHLLSQINIIKSYPTLLNLPEKEYIIVQKEKKSKQKNIKKRCKQRKYKKHIIDGRKLKESKNYDSLLNPEYVEYYCNNCKYNYDDTDWYEHVIHNNNLFHCCYNNDWSDHDDYYY